VIGMKYLIVGRSSYRSRTSADPDDFTALMAARQSALL
jgi:hypothetical protein